MKSKFTVAAAAIGATLVLASAPAMAQHYHGGHGGWHGRGGWGGAGAGFVAGALLGGAIASAPGYYYEPGYAYAPGPAYGPDDAYAYCVRRYRSYDPQSGTFLGNDGYRHPCP